jgi:hypothetical protein
MKQDSYKLYNTMITTRLHLGMINYRKLSVLSYGYLENYREEFNLSVKLLSVVRILALSKILWANF